jgi:hypothetical protein
MGAGAFIDDRIFKGCGITRPRAAMRCSREQKAQ